MGLKVWLGASALQVFGALLFVAGFMAMFFAGIAYGLIGFIMGIVILIFGLILIATGGYYKTKEKRVREVKTEK